MKKVFSLCMIVWILFGLCTAPVFAAGDDVCVVVGQFDSIRYDGKVYQYWYHKGIEVMDETSVRELEFRFQDRGLTKKFKYAGVCISEDNPHLLFVRYEDVNGYYYTYYMVEESRQQEATDFASNRKGGEYLTVSDFGEDTLLLDGEAVQSWLHSSEMLHIPPAQMEYENVHKLICQAPDIGLMERVGDILGAYDENGQPVFYLVHYREYEDEYFHASGSFSMEGTKQAKFYRLSDEDLTEKLSEYYGMTPVEDDLEWVVSDELPEEAMFILSLILFGILPVALMAFALIWIFIKQPKNPYFAVLCVIIFAAAEIAISYAALAMLLQ